MMDNHFTNISNIVLSKVTFITVALSWIFIAAAFYQRGFLAWNGHFLSDPVLFQTSVMINLPAVLCAAAIVPEFELQRDALVFAVLITIQWIIIGSLIKCVFVPETVKK